MPTSSSVREILQELGSPPELPTKRELDRMLAKFKPEKLVRAKTKLKEVVRKKFHPHFEETPPLIDGISTALEEKPVNKTHVLEMELLKLKGQFHKNKTTTMHMIKKLSNERELVKESIKELTTTRSEELSLIEAVKRDNFDLTQKKIQLEEDLASLSERIEMLLGSVSATQRNIVAKEEKLQSMEQEKFEMNKKIETLEQKLKENGNEKRPECLHHQPTTNSGGSESTDNSFLYFGIFVLFVAALVFFYRRLSSVSEIPELPCKDCDYERDVYSRINI